MVAPTNLTEKRACLKPLEQLNNILRPVNIRELNYRLASVGLKSEKMCKYSHRHTSFDCFIYINTKDITHQDTFFCVLPVWVPRDASMVFRSWPWRAEKVWLVTYLILMTHTLALSQTAPHKMAALTVVFSRLENVEIYETGQEIARNYCVL